MVVCKFLITVQLLLLLISLSTCQKDQKGKEPAFTSDNPPRVMIGQVKKWIDQGEDIVFLDSRKASDWMATRKKLPGALRVPPDSVEITLPKIPKDKIIVVYCA